MSCSDNAKIPPTGVGILDLSLCGAMICWRKRIGPVHKNTGPMWSWHVFNFCTHVKILTYPILCALDPSCSLCWDVSFYTFYFNTSTPNLFYCNCCLIWDQEIPNSPISSSFLFFMVVEVGETRENDGWHNIFNTNTTKDDIKLVSIIKE